MYDERNTCAPDPGFYPEGAYLPQGLDPLVDRALCYAEQIGGLRVENRHISGEARSYQRKLDEQEEANRRLVNRNNNLTEDNKTLDNENDELANEITKLEKKLAPKPKKVTKTKKGKK